MHSATQNLKPNLQIETIGIPALSNQFDELLAQYVEEDGIFFNDWSTDGKSILVRKRTKNTRQAFLINQALAKPHQLTDFDEPVLQIRSAKVNTYQGFIFGFNKGGDENNQIYYYDFDSKKTYLITDGTSKNSFWTWANISNQFAFCSNKRNGVDFDIYIARQVSATKFELEMVLELEGSWHPVSWSFDDQFLIISKYISNNETEPYLLNLSTKKLTKVNQSDKKIAFETIAFTQNHHSLYLINNQDTEFLSLKYVDLATNKIKNLTEHIPWNVENFSLNKLGDTLAFITNENGYYKIYLLNTITRKIKSLHNLPNGQVNKISFNNTGDLLAMNITSSQFPNRVYVYHIHTGETNCWTTNENKNAKHYVQPNLYHYPTFDIINNTNRTIPAFCYLPPVQQSPSPTLIHIHGGPEGQFLPDYIPFFQFLIKELGIAIVAPNVRGSRGYGKTYLDLDNGYKREDSVKDIGTLLDWIEKHPQLNGNKVGVMGGSYGGYMVYASLIHFANRLICGISRVGISNFVTFLENTKAYRRNMRRAEYGDERISEMCRFLNDISPSNHASKITKPLFIVQGANDPRVPQSEAEQMLRAVQQNGTPVWYMLAKNEGHGLRKKENMNYYRKAVIAFLQKYLLK